MAATHVVLLRAETGPTTGIGHVMRSRAVALALRELGAEPRFVVDDEGSADALRAEGFEALVADSAARWTAAPARSAWLDGRRDLATELAALHARGVPCLLVESRAHARELAAAVVQPALHHAPDEWEARHPGRVLAGARWIPLAPEVLAQRPAAVPDVDLLVTFGGSDPLHLTERALAALAGCGRRVAVAVGPHMAARRPAIEELARPASARVLEPGAALPPWMARARLALTAVGTTLYELAHLRVRALVLANYDADRAALDHYARRGPHVPLGIAGELGAGALRARLLAALAAPPAPAPAVPGLGAGAHALARRLLGTRAPHGAVEESRGLDPAGGTREPRRSARRNRLRGRG